MFNIIIEKMHKDHLKEVLEIYNYYVVNSTATFHANVLTEDEMGELVFFDNPKYETFIIKASDMISGYVLLTQFKKREAYDVTAEVTIYLKHDYIGKGIGSKALKFIEKTAHERGIHSLVAIICGENTDSIKLFERNSYFKCAHYKEVGMKFGKFLDVVCYQKIIT